jgi:hypothetical protein
MDSRLATALLLTALLAGCSDPPAPADVDPGTPGTQTEETEAPFTVMSPGWQVGDWWSHHWTSPANGLDFTVKSIVASNASGTSLLATDLKVIAAQHAAFFFMDLGEMGADGTLRAGAFAFPWYQFPLVDNKTWTAQETNVGDDFEPVTRTIAFTARQMGTGAGAHFAIEGRVDGKLYVEYDYKPETGWFSEFRSYSLTAEGDEPVEAFTIKTEDQGTGFTGAYFSSVGDLLVNTQTLVHPGSTGLPAGTLAFSPESAHTDVFGILFSFAAAGAHSTQLVAPDGQHWATAGAGDPDGNQVGVTPVPGGTLVLTPTQPGDWHVNVGGAGLVAGGGAIIWGVAVTEGTL